MRGNVREISETRSRLIIHLQASALLSVKPAFRRLIKNELGVRGDAALIQRERDDFELQLLSFLDFECVVVQLAGLTQLAIDDSRNLQRLRVGWRIVLHAGFGNYRLRVQ